MQFSLILNKDITINYNVEQQDIIKYNELLQIGANNGTEEFISNQQYIGDELFLRCKKLNHIVCISEKRLRSKVKNNICYECVPNSRRKLNIIDYNLRAFESGCKFLDNIENGNLIHGKIPDIIKTCTGYYQCLQCNRFFTITLENFKGCSTCNAIIKKIEDPNFGNIKVLQDYTNLPSLMDKSGKYLGTLQHDGIINSNMIPDNTISNLACWQCGICNYVWKAGYSSINMVHGVRLVLEIYQKLYKIILIFL